jgi:hypothetical protein
MMNYKKLLFIILSGAVVIIIPIVFLFISRVQTPIGKPYTNVNPSIFPNISPTLPPSLARVVNVYPEENTTTTFLPVQQVSITFSSPLETVAVIDVSPKVNFKILPDTNNPNTLVISPDPVWKTGITTISIKKNNIVDKPLLDREFIYKINTGYPKNPDSVE